MSEMSFAAAVRHRSPAKHPDVAKQHRVSPPNWSGIPAFDYRRGTSDWPFGPGFNLQPVGHQYVSEWLEHHQRSGKSGAHANTLKTSIKPQCKNK
jgi:hypothetical protein